jgi:hypothetical protein
MAPHRSTWQGSAGHDAMRSQSGITMASTLVTVDASLQEPLERHVAEQSAVAQKRKIIRDASSLMCWSAVVAALLVGCLFNRAGWIPPDTRPLTGESGLFSDAKSEVFLIGATVILLMGFLRFRAGVYGDDRSERISNYIGMGLGAPIFIGIITGIIFFYGYVSYWWLQVGNDLPSTMTLAAMGIVIVAVVFSTAYLTRKKLSTFSMEGDMPFGFVQRAIEITGRATGILIGLPVAVLFGFSMSFLVLIIIEHAGWNVEPLRMFFNQHTRWFVALTTTGFLVLSALVHAGRRALRPQHAPVFIGTMVGTGLAITVVKFACMFLIGMK